MFQVNTTYSRKAIKNFIVVCVFSLCIQVFGLIPSVSAECQLTTNFSCPPLRSQACSVTNGNGFDFYCCSLSVTECHGLPPQPTVTPIPPPTNTPGPTSPFASCGSQLQPNDPRTCPQQCSQTFVNGQRCCGWNVNNTCSGTAPAVTPSPTTAAAPTVTLGNEPLVNSLFLHQVNPLTIQGNDKDIIAFAAGWVNVGKFGTPAAFINVLLPFLFGLAGMILFIMIIWGGFEMMMSAADVKMFDSGKNRVSSALIGFALLFCSYWFAQIVQFIFGANILG